jgi:hypothetical protein
MAWFGVGIGSRRAKPQRARRFVQVDCVVAEAFADLHEARHLKSKSPGISRGAVQQFERKAWNRLITDIIAPLDAEKASPPPQTCKGGDWSTCGLQQSPGFAPRSNRVLVS